MERLKSLGRLLTEKPPRPDKKTVPFYYRKMMVWTYRLLAIYLVMCAVFCLWVEDIRAMMFAAAMAVCGGILQFYLEKVRYRASWIIYAIIIMLWTVCSVGSFGWDGGVQLLLLPVMVIIFFSIYETLLTKILCGVILLSFRLFAYFFNMRNMSDVLLSNGQISVMQVINTVAVFIHLGVVCYILSTNIQETEKNLMLYMEKLEKKAKTDPLTRLMNRASMEEMLERYMESNSKEVYSVAIADIDHFKVVNDTYGHECGDVVLQEISDLFLRMCRGKAHVCRWGGEEFMFFMPGMNLDDARILLVDLNVAVSRKLIKYQDMELTVTITIGAEESYNINEHKEVLKIADEKLYMGKERGRNKVIV